MTWKMFTYVKLKKKVKKQFDIYVLVYMSIYMHICQVGSNIPLNVNVFYQKAWKMIIIRKGLFTNQYRQPFAITFWLTSFLDPNIRSASMDYYKSIYSWFIRKFRYSQSHLKTFQSTFVSNLDYIFKYISFLKYWYNWINIAKELWAS